MENHPVASARAPDIFDLPRLTRALPQFRQSFEAALPFRHVVIDDFFTEDLARHLYDEFPKLAPAQRSVARLLEARSYDSAIHRHAPVFTETFDVLGGRSFVAWLEALAGIARLDMDPHNVGGGLHQGADGSSLHAHADHNTHPKDPSLYRRLNVLVYLSRRWEPAWGGALELYDAAGKIVVAKVDAKFNRCVIMDVHDTAFHGYRRLHLPADQTRKSIAAYYYSNRPSVLQTVHAHPTLFGNPADMKPLEAIGYRVRRAILHRWPRLNGLPPPGRK